MLAEERRHHLLSVIADRGRVRISDLAQLFNVSEMTIHRDIRLLEHEGMVRKLHGGVAIAGIEEIPYRSRIVAQHRQKVAIAEASIPLIKPRMTIYLSPGTTTTELARRLQGNDLTIVTNSLPIAEELMRSSQHEVILIGGSIRRYAEALVGPLAEESLANIFINLAFVGVTGMDLVAGLTVYAESEARVLRSVLRSARKAIVMADSSKWGKVMGPQVAGLEAIHVLISDTGLGHEAAHQLRALDIEVILAEPSGGEE